MGAVYEAVDERLQVTVALKEALSTDDRLRRQFQREAQLLAQLHHPVLPRVTDHFIEGDRAFLVMQHISGNDLAAVIARQPGPFPANQVVAWADQLLDALIYLHSSDRQILHRDIKPHNLKVTENGRIALLDFGLAKRHASHPSGASSAISIFGYTRCYAPLEQIQDEGTTPRSDIYALGATLYHLLTGVKPPDALVRAAALIGGRPDPLRPADEVNGAVGSELADLLSCAMEQNPDKRYRSAKEFRAALRHIGRTDEVRKVIPDLKPRAQSCEAEDEGTTVVGSAGNFSAGAVSAQKISTPRTRGLLIAAAVVLSIIGGGAVAGHYLKSEAQSEIGRVAQAENTTVDGSLQSYAPSSKRAQTTKSAYARPRTFETTQLARLSTKTSSVNDGSIGSDKSASRKTLNVRLPAASALRLKLNRTPMPEPPHFTPQLADQISLPAIQSISSARQRSVPDPHVLRSVQGIKIVKYSDGSRRVFRPGERVSSAGEQ